MFIKARGHQQFKEFYPTQMVSSFCPVLESGSVRPYRLHEAIIGGLQFRLNRHVLSKTSVLVRETFDVLLIHNAEFQFLGSDSCVPFGPICECLNLRF